MNASAEANAKRAGLFLGDASNRVPVPLEGVKVHAEIVGHASRVTLAQRFRNTEAVPIEAVYVFPVPEGAAVCGLAMRVGDRSIEGEVEEREKAFDRFDDALAAGEGAALLDAERPNVFTISVGNILPGQAVAIELRWVAELPVEGDALRFMLPTTVAPRYAPDADRHGISPTPAERVSPPVEFEVPYGLELDVEVTLPCAVRAVDSPSHPVHVEIDGSRAHVTLSHGSAAMDRDFVLLVTPRAAGRPQVLVERNDDGLVTAAVSFVPQFDAIAGPKEVIFLVDRSGSMGGDSIEQVRAALQLCLRSLRDGDRFNIVGFGSTFMALFPGSVVYGQASLEEATAHVNGLDADLGGTEILPALRAVLEHEPVAGLAREVVLLTDGEVSNEAAVIELAREQRARTRIFTFGIGSGASEFLVRSLARVTRGEAEFIHPGERIEPKVLRQFRRLGAPALRDVTAEWHGADTTLRAPHEPPAIFSGEARTLYARFHPGANLTVTLSADSEGKRVSWTLPVEASRAEAGSLLAALAARAAIRDLEEGTSALHETARGSAQRDRRDARVKKEIAALGIAYRLASSETSFVAIERREAAGQPAAELRRVPVALTQGWGGMRAVIGAACGGPALALPSTKTAMSVVASLPRAALDRLAPQGRFNLTLRRPAVERCPSTEERLSRSAPPPSPSRPHVGLACLQRADGSWRLDAAFADAIGVGPADLEAIAATIGRDAGARTVVATLAALRFLKARAADAQDEWRLLAEKAERWLAKELATRPAGARVEVERLVAGLFG